MDILLLAFLVHVQDAVLPLWVVARYANADVGNDPCVIIWYPLSYGSYEDAVVGLVVTSVGQLGDPLQFPEVDVLQLVAHAQFPHLLLVDLLDHWIPELFAEQLEKLLPAGVLVSWSRVSIIVVVFVVFIVGDVPL